MWSELPISERYERGWRAVQAGVIDGPLMLAAVLFPPDDIEIDDTRAFCANGHPWNEKNIRYRRPLERKHPWCRVCHNQRRRRK